jgi:glycosyltransferase involved in cell wall biosynthesis
MRQIASGDEAASRARRKHIGALRVVVTHVDFPLYWPARLKALHQRLREHGAELIVLEAASGGGAYGFAGEGNASTVPHWIRLYEQVSLDSISPRQLARRIWTALDQLDPDVVLCGAIAFTPGATAVQWCRHRRRGVIVMDDARLVDVPRRWSINAVKRRFFANTDAVFIPAESHRQTYHFFGVPQKRIFYGVNAVDNSYFNDRCALIRGQQQRVVQEQTLPLRYFLGAGRQVPKKNWLTLIRAYALYRRRQTAAPWNLVLVGDGPEREAIVGLINREGLSQLVQLILFVAPDEMPILYANAACLILPSFHGETWGLVVNEAMASGLPVLVSEQCGCASTLVEPGTNGWTFDPNDPEELCNLMVRMAALDDQTLSGLGKNSRQMIAHWSVDRFAQGASDAIHACATVSRGFANLIDRLILSAWRGRFRPT